MKNKAGGGSLSASLLRDLSPFTTWSSLGQGNGKIPFVIRLETVLSQESRESYFQARKASRRRSLRLYLQRRENERERRLTELRQKEWKNQ